MRDITGLRAVLPQRHPLLLLDRVAELRPGEEIVALKAVSATEPCYARVPDGSPSGAYAYPTSLLIESFGQAAAALWLGSVGADPDGVLLFGGARGCRIEGRAYPGDVLVHRVRLEKVIAETAFATGATWVGERLILSVESVLAARRPRGALAGLA